MPDFSTESSLFSLFYTLLFGSKSLSTHISGGGVGGYHLLQGGLFIYTSYLEFSKGFVSSLLFINLFNLVFTAAWTHGHLFYSVAYKPVLPLFILFLRFQLWPWGTPSASFGHALSFCEHGLNFLAPQDISGSSCNFPAPVLDSATSPRSSDSFS